jgi:multidrug efflux pump subunit AcrA (membrane-fusion protein)
MKSSITALVLLFLLTCCNSKQEKTVTPVQPKITEPVRIIAIGRVEPEVKITEIGSEVNGVIRKIYTHAGDTVKKGELLVEFAHDFEDAKLQQTTSKIAAQQAEIQNIQAQINSASIKPIIFVYKTIAFKKHLQKERKPRQNADNAKASYLQSLKEIERLQAALRSAQSKVNEMGADTKVASVDIERRKVKAPADGVILTMDLTEGGAGTTEKPCLNLRQIRH